MRTTALVICAAAALAAPGVWAGSSTMTLVISVATTSGACSTNVQPTSVNVSCGAVATVPLLPSAGGWLSGAGSRAALLGGAFGMAAPPFLGSFEAESDPTDRLRDPALPPGDTGGPDPARQQLAVLPSSVTGRSPVPVFGGGANVISWRVVSIDNAQHVELTISW